jgi:hypothetical protein
MVRRVDFRITAGAGALKAWTSPRSGDQRLFCDQCGTRIANRTAQLPAHLMLVVATLDEEIDESPVAHINLESKALWYEIRDGAAQFDGLPPGREGRPR